MSEKSYSVEPADKQGFTEVYDQFYTRFALLYDWGLKAFPVWRRWISRVLPYVRGPMLLEVSFGTGYLLDKFGPDVEVVAVEYNREMIRVARKNTKERGQIILINQADVNQLPFQSGTFDTVVSTMAFTAYPDGQAAMSEMCRVLRNEGRLLMVDVNYPDSGSRPGMLMAKLWMKLGDILRDMAPIFQEAGFTYVDKEIGGWGSVHLYIAKKTE